MLFGKIRQRDEVTSLCGEAKTCLGDCSMKFRQPSTLHRDLAKIRAEILKYRVPSPREPRFSPTQRLHESADLLHPNEPGRDLR
jgi:hypothetical protein